MSGIMIYYFDDNAVDLLYGLACISVTPAKKRSELVYVVITRKRYIGIIIDIHDK